MSFWKNLGLDVATSSANGVISSIFGGLGAAISGRIQRRNAEHMFQLQKQENEQIFQQNRQLAQEQNQMNIDQWNRENAYNTPASQMQRFAAAGLNPDLIYNQGNTSAGSPSLVAGTPKQAASRAESAQAAAAQMAQVQNMYQQNALLGAQISKTKAETRNIESQIVGQDLDNLFNEFTFDQRSAAIMESVNNMMSNTAINDEQKRILTQEYKMISEEAARFVTYYNNVLEIQDYSKKQMAFDMMMKSKEFERDLNESLKRIEQMSENIRLSQQQREQLKAVVASLYCGMGFTQAQTTALYAMLPSQIAQGIINLQNSVLTGQLTGAQIVGLTLDNKYNAKTFGSRVLEQNYKTLKMGGDAGKSLWEFVTAPLNTVQNMWNNNLNFLKGFGIK